MILKGTKVIKDTPNLDVWKVPMFEELLIDGSKRESLIKMLTLFKLTIKEIATPPFFELVDISNDNM
jgi:hypothetical protein